MPQNSGAKVIEPDRNFDSALPAQPIDPPTLAMLFRINDGPFAGQEGDKVHVLFATGQRDQVLRVLAAGPQHGGA